MIKAQHRERKHQTNAIPAQSRGSRVPQAAHVPAEEKRRFLVHERNTTHGVPGREGLKHARDLAEHRRRYRDVNRVGAKRYLQAHVVPRRVTASERVALGEREHEIESGLVLLAMVVDRHQQPAIEQEIASVARLHGKVQLGDEDRPV